jgi:hypothetical protein
MQFSRKDKALQSSLYRVARDEQLSPRALSYLNRLKFRLMKILIFPMLALLFTLTSCDDRGDGPTYKVPNPEGQPERQTPTPTPNSETGQGSGTRSDYQPSTGQGARQDGQ